MKNLIVLSLLMLAAQSIRAASNKIECTTQNSSQSAEFVNGQATLVLPATKTDEVFKIKITRGKDNKNHIYSIRKIDLIGGSILTSIDHAFNHDDIVTIVPGIECQGLN